MRSRTQVTRFSREVVDGVEWFAVRCIHDDGVRVERRHHFSGAAQFKTWLTAEQEYAEAEADTLIAHLREHKSAT